MISVPTAREFTHNNMPDDVPCETETCRVVDGHGVGVSEAGTTLRSALKTVYVYIYKATYLGPSGPSSDFQH
jgi:hypothetical protein